MKKYNIHSLYVVEIPNSDDVNYFICKYNETNNTYIEIFTNKKIKITEHLHVEKLSSYYSVLALYDYRTSKPLFLDQKELLKKFLMINNEASFEKGKQIAKNNTLDINKILEEATLNFFPQTGTINDDLVRNPNILDIENIIWHLNDDYWLVKIFKTYHKLTYISTSKILEFIRTSTLFQEKKHEYEEKVVKWLIDLIINYEDNSVLSESYLPDFIFKLEVYDLDFRNGLIKTLLKMGMKLDNIEKYLEKNATKWQDYAMNMTFKDKYELPFLYGLEPVDPEFKEKWLKLRKYEYYLKHKKVVDKYNPIPHPLLTNQELIELKEYLKKKHNERMYQIEEYQSSHKARILQK